MLIMRRHMRFSSYHSRGLALSVILLAVVLLAALGVAVAIGSRSGPTNISSQKAKILAATLLHQAQAYRDADLAMMQAKGMPYFNPDLTTSGFYSMTDPAQGYTEPQQPPTDAYVSAASATWILKKDTSNGNATVTLMNVGTTAADYTIATVNLKIGVCQQLNQLLGGSTTIPVETVGTSTAWSTAATVMDLSGEAAVNGKTAQCVQTMDGQYVFYSTLRIM